MINDFLNSLNCVLPSEVSDYHNILDIWSKEKYQIAFMPAIFWYSGIYNLFDQKACANNRKMIWFIPVGQAGFFWLPGLRQKVVGFYETGEMEINNHVHFPGIEAETFEECILLHTSDLQNNHEHNVLGANVLLFRLSLSSGSDTILFILLDHQDNCWMNIIEKYNIPLTWLVDSGRGMGDYFLHVNLYQLMKHTSKPDTLPALYFKGLYNKGEIPEGFRFLYSMFSHPNETGYDEWKSFSSVYSTGWKAVDRIS